MKRKVLILIYASIIALAAVSFLVILEAKDVPLPLELSVISSEGTERLSCWKGEDGYYVFLPSYASMDRVLIGKTSNTKVRFRGTALENTMEVGNIRMNEPYPVEYWAFGIRYESTVTFVQSENIPTLFLDTKSGNMDLIHGSKNNEESGAVRIYTRDGQMDFSGTVKSLKGRGNTSWTLNEKKPYTLTLEEPHNLLGLGSGSKWILLANAADYSNVRNKLVFDYAKAIGMPYVPDSAWVNVYLNGEYAGLYLLCEKIEVNPDRVDISVEGSFLVSMEAETRLLSSGDPYFATDNGQVLRLRYAADEEFAAQIMQAVEDAVMSGSSEEILKQIDLDSWVKKYLVDELFGNLDACYLSQYFYYDASDPNGKVFAGPVWDYDLSMGKLWQMRDPRVFYGNRSLVKAGIYAPWFCELYKNKVFYEHMVRTFETVCLPAMEELLENKLPEYAELVASSAETDRIRWGISMVETETDLGAYLSEHVDFLKDVWIREEPYYIVQSDSGTGVNYIYHAVKPGQTLAELPIHVESEYSAFQGWCYAESGKPIDPDKPIDGDLEIYAKWKVDRRMQYLDDILPIGLFAVAFLGLLISMLHRMRKGG